MKMKKYAKHYYEKFALTQQVILYVDAPDADEAVALLDARFKAEVCSHKWVDVDWDHIDSWSNLVEEFDPPGRVDED